MKQVLRSGVGRLKLALPILLVCGLSNAGPVVHQFGLWRTAGTGAEKLSLYWGWTNGFLQARGQRTTELVTCLEGMTAEQAIAMVDKYYKDHPEKWSRPFGEQLLEALTVAGGPCEGKNPLAPRAN